ncbi:DUF4232 domain-containing protein [Arthrobacter sp. ATA002]|uniref:DUF4232 domain-containing protein n=1 Tax=Arthrobacter sp. ATA002 TaxID=2991715 RepID=UPI003FA49BED
MRLWKSSSVSAVAIGAVLALTGCGSGGGETASSESPAPSSASSSAGAPASGPETSAPGAGDPTASATAAAPAPSAGPGSCSVADLAGSVEESIGGGAAGSVYRSLVLTNVSTAPCTAAPGYPGVSYINAAGQQLGAAAVRSGEAVTGEPILLEPNQSVVSELGRPVPRIMVLTVCPNRQRSWSYTRPRTLNR